MVPIKVLYARQQSNLLEAENRRKEVARLKGYVFCGAPSYGERISSGNNDEHSLECKIVNQLDLISRHEARIEEIEEERYLTHQMIFELKNNTQIKIIEGYYFEGKDIEEISVDLKKTTDWIYKLYNKSMKELKRIRSENPDYMLLNR